jgi:O-methyltransferase
MINLPMKMTLVSLVARKVNKVLSFFGLSIMKISPYQKFIFPVEFNQFERINIQNAKKYSLTTFERMSALTVACKHVIVKNIPGDFVECGVWKGGNLILMSTINSYTGSKRKIHGFDTFTGMTEPTDIDRDLWGESAKSLLSRSEYKDGTASFHAFASKELVGKILNDNGCFDVNLVEGDVAKTLFLKSNLPSHISILRLDTDWYESTKIELEVLYPLLVPGGILIIDDYGHFSGARKAVDEYFKDDLPFMFHVDYSCRMIIKKEKS